MANFDVSEEWVILVQPDAACVKKAVGDLSRYIGLLAGLNINAAPKPPVVTDASGPAPSEAVPVILLNSEGYGPERNGFSWRAAPRRIEIYGESGRGLCNGIYSFLAALGISWPAPGQELLPTGEAKNPQGFPLTSGGVHEPSPDEGSDLASSAWRRFIPAGEGEIKRILKKSETFAAWAARRRYDALIFPLKTFSSGAMGRKLKQLKQHAGEYGIALEAGGRDLSSLVPRGYFFFHRDFFRMEEGRREKAHHFCPTNPGVVRIIGIEGKKLFLAAGDTKVFHLWPDRGAETTWCSCPTCRAFTPPEQNRIGVNAAADVLAALNPGAVITFYEKSGEGGNIPLRKNLLRFEDLPDGDKELTP